MVILISTKKKRRTMETIKLNEDQIKELEELWEKIKNAKIMLKQSSSFLKQSHTDLRNKIQEMFPDKTEMDWDLTWSSKKIVFREKGEFSGV